MKKSKYMLQIGFFALFFVFFLINHKQSNAQNFYEFLKASEETNNDAPDIEPFSDPNWRLILNTNNDAENYLKSRNLDKCGYHANVYINEMTKEIIIAHEGTYVHFLAAPYKSFKDAASDINIAENITNDKGIENEQVNAAFMITQKFISDKNFHSWKIYQTGFSLGGFLAQVCGMHFNQVAVAFDPPGTKEFVQKVLKIPPLTISKNSNNIISIYHNEDIVNRSGTPFGTVIRIGEDVGQNKPSRLTNMTEFYTDLNNILKLKNHNLEIFENYITKKGEINNYDFLQVYPNKQKSDQLLNSMGIHYIASNDHKIVYQKVVPSSIAGSNNNEIDEEITKKLDFVNLGMNVLENIGRMTYAFQILIVKNDAKYSTFLKQEDENLGYLEFLGGLTTILSAAWSDYSYASKNNDPRLLVNGNLMKVLRYTTVDLIVSKSFGDKIGDYGTADFWKYGLNLLSGKPMTIDDETYLYLGIVKLSSGFLGYQYGLWTKQNPITTSKAFQHFFGNSAQLEWSIEKINMMQNANDKSNFLNDINKEQIDRIRQYQPMEQIDLKDGLRHGMNNIEIKQYNEVVKTQNTAHFANLIEQLIAIHKIISSNDSKNGTNLETNKNMKPIVPKISSNVTDPSNSLSSNLTEYLESHRTNKPKPNSYTYPWFSYFDPLPNIHDEGENNKKNLPAYAVAPVSGVLLQQTPTYNQDISSSNSTHVINSQQPSQNSLYGDYKLLKKNK